MIAFIDAHRESYGVEPICKVLPVAPSTYRSHAAQQRDETKLSARGRRDRALGEKIRRVFAENFSVYGARKVWRQLRREGEDVARCTVERLMRRLSLQGVVRGRPAKTTVSDSKAPCPRDKVNRLFAADRPNRLWVADFTYVATWQGFVYVAFVIDVFARRIVGWRVSRSAQTPFVLDALEQALCDRQPVRGGLVHHSDRGVQGGFNRPSQRLINSSSDECIQCFRWRSPIQRFSRSRVHGLSDSLQGFRAVLGKIGSLGKILAQQPVCVFVRASLPRAVRITKIDKQAGIDPQAWMLSHFCSLVPRQRSA
jgi:putative transposase